MDIKFRDLTFLPVLQSHSESNNVIVKTNFIQSQKKRLVNKFSLNVFFAFYNSGIASSTSYTIGQVDAFFIDNLYI